MAEKSVRTPKQQRSIEKKNAIKQAAVTLISEKGYHNTSSNEIAKVAGISIGTFYSYFSDKKALYEELVADLYDGMLTGTPELEFSETTSVREAVRTYVELVLKGHEYMTAFQREISSLSIQYEEFRLLEEKSRSQISSVLFTIMSENIEVIRITDFKTGSLVIKNMLESVIHEYAFYENDYDRERVIDELTDAICRYCIKPEYL